MGFVGEFLKTRVAKVGEVGNCPVCCAVKINVEDFRLGESHCSSVYSCTVLGRGVNPEELLLRCRMMMKVLNQLVPRCFGGNSLETEKLGLEIGAF